MLSHWNYVKKSPQGQTVCNAQLPLAGPLCNVCNLAESSTHLTSPVATELAVSTAEIPARI